MKPVYIIAGWILVFRKIQIYRNVSIHNAWNTLHPAEKKQNSILMIVCAITARQLICCLDIRCMQMKNLVNVLNQAWCLHVPHLKTRLCGVIWCERGWERTVRKREREWEMETESVFVCLCVCVLFPSGRMQKRSLCKPITGKHIKRTKINYTVPPNDKLPP